MINHVPHLSISVPRNTIRAHCTPFLPGKLDSIRRKRIQVNCKFFFVGKYVMQNWQGSNEENYGEIGEVGQQRKVCAAPIAGRRVRCRI